MTVSVFVCVCEHIIFLLFLSLFVCVSNYHFAVSVFVFVCEHYITVSLWV